MPDIYTPRPDIVRQVLKDAGFEAQVEPTIITDRPAEITYRFRGKDYYAEFYVHDLGDSPVLTRAAFPDIASAAVGLLVGAVLAAVFFRLRRRQT